MSKTTPDNLTPEQLRTLATVAGLAGNTRLVVACEVALWGESDTDPNTKLTRDDARRLCADAINAANEKR